MESARARPVPLLPQLIEEARTPLEGTAEVDALLYALRTPLAPGASRRERADLLLGILKDEDLRDRLGGDKSRVGSVAFTALRALGPQYAEEVPAHVARAYSEVRSSDPYELDLDYEFEMGGPPAPVGVKIIWSIALLESAVALFLAYILGSGGTALFSIPPTLVLLYLLPAVFGTTLLPLWLATLGRRKDWPGVQMLGIGLLLLVGLGYFIGFLTSQLLVARVIALGLTGAYCISSWSLFGAGDNE